MVKKLSEFLVNKRAIVTIIMLAITALCGFLTMRVGMNTDMTKYLSENSEMKQGLDIMDSDFPDTTESSIRVMFDDISDDQKEEILSKLKAIPYVDSVDYDADSSDYNKDNHTLFVVKSNYGYDTYEEQQIEETIGSEFTSYTMMYHNNDTIKTELEAWVVIMAMAILIGIMLLMSESWIEPFIFLSVIGIAIVINLGTNIFLGYVSDMTMSIGPLLQLVLSLDYSIMLMSRYREERKKTDNNVLAMKNAVKGAFTSVSSSTLTTVAGLIVLVFLSFKIGPEIGIVLAKGVFISMICVFTMLPAFILLFTKAIDKTKKKTFNFKMGGLAKFAVKSRIVLPIVFIGLIIGSYIVQTKTPITFTEGNVDAMADIFPKDNTVVLLYNNSDEKGAEEVASDVEALEHVKSVTTYNNTIGKKETAAQMAKNISSMGSDSSIDELTARMIYYDFYDGTLRPATLSDISSTISSLQSNPDYADYFDKDTDISMLVKYSDKAVITSPMSANELAAYFDMDETMVTQLLGLYAQATGDMSMTMSPQAYIAFITDNVLSNPMYASQFDEATTRQLYMAKNLMDAVAGDVEFTPEQFIELVKSSGTDIDINQVNMIYLISSSMRNFDEGWTMSIEEFFNHINDDIVNDAKFNSMFDDETKKEIADSKAKLDDGITKLKGNTYSRIIITTDYPDESDETLNFIKTVDNLREEKLSNNSYMIGNSVLVYELSNTFQSEYMVITILNAAVIFAVVAITFRSFLVPLILVLIVQCGVFITVSSILMMGNSIYYLALLIVQSILMGATIDYGIELMSLYKNNRQTMSVRDAMAAALRGAAPTIFTSGTILVAVTGVLGAFTSDITSEVCKTISIGALTAILLIVFILPSIIVLLDRGIAKKKKEEVKNEL